MGNLITYTRTEIIKWGEHHFQLIVQKTPNGIWGNIGMANDEIAGTTQSFTKDENVTVEEAATALFEAFLNFNPITNDAIHSDALALAYEWLSLDGEQECKRARMLSEAISQYEYEELSK